MNQTPFEWQRGPRTSFSLGTEAGVYALFLRDATALPGVQPGASGLIYIGLATNRNGLKGRCHFDARTRNHSPRKSLAVLLLNELSLAPVLIPKPSSADTWGLDGPSDARLSAWMHANLELAIEVCANPDARETELIGHYAPPLNLTKCIQTPNHRRISLARANVMSELQTRHGLTARPDLVVDEIKSAKLPTAVGCKTMEPVQPSSPSACRRAELRRAEPRYLPLFDLGCAVVGLERP